MDSGWYGENYSGSEGLDQACPTSGYHRVVRGGSWFNSAQNGCSAYRNNATPEIRGGNVGFRLVRTWK